jgi:hypothetical protein
MVVEHFDPVLIMTQSVEVLAIFITLEESLHWVQETPPHAQGFHARGIPASTYATM